MMVETTRVLKRQWRSSGHFYEKKEIFQKATYFVRKFPGVRQCSDIKHSANN
jgi:hypothetical protein